MSYYKFNENDIFYNTIEANPEYSYYIHDGTIYLDYLQEISGTYSDNITGVPTGSVSLYEYNINRKEDQRIYPFITKGGIRSTLSSVTATEWNTGYGYGGEDIRGNYNLSASITRIPITTSTRPKITALTNVLNYYAINSPHYQYSSSFGNKETQDINLINIPAILYGSSISKGTVSLKFYVSGTIVGEASDIRRNGELVQTGPYGSTGSGSVAGVVLYNEGLLLLTGSWALDANSITYDGSTDVARWKYFGMGANDDAVIDNTNLSSSFSISYTDVVPDFKKTTYISKIAVYDENKNLIGIAKVATPVRKTEEKEYTFKLKIDI